VVATRAYSGIKSGYTLKNIQPFGDFPGGLMFVSSNNEVRIMTGLQALPVATSVDNIRTMNYGQNIKSSLSQELINYSNIHAEFFDNKYHLIIDNNVHVFDIRTQEWTDRRVITENYKSEPSIMAVLNQGTPDVPLYNLFSVNPVANFAEYPSIEQEYSGVQYENQEVSAKLISGYILASSKYIQYEKIRFWFKTTNGSGATINVRITLDDNVWSAITDTVVLSSPTFNPTYYNSQYYQTTGFLDFDVSNVNMPARWLKYSLDCVAGNASLQRIEFVGEQLENEER
jgi:hypothetical protein